MIKKWKIGLIAVTFGAVLMSGIPSLAAEIGLEPSCAPAGIANMDDGSLLVADTYHKVVWKLQDGKSSLFAGTPGTEGMYGEPEGGYRDDALKLALFGEPWAIAPFKGGYAVSDPANNAVRLLADNKVRTININKTLSNPTGLAADSDGSLYIADTNHDVILKVTADGRTSVWLSGLSEPTGLTYHNGSLYIADSGNNRIVKAEAGKIVTVIGGPAGGYADGELQNALFANPMGITVDDNGIIYVADTGNSAVRRIQGNTVSTLLAGDKKDTGQDLVSPVGLQVIGGKIYIGDVFIRKMIVILPEQGVVK